MSVRVITLLGITDGHEIQKTHDPDRSIVITVSFRVTSTARDAEVPKPPQHIQNVDEFSINLSEYADRLKQIKFEGDGERNITIDSDKILSVTAHR